VTPTADAAVLGVLARADAAFTVSRIRELAGRYSESGLRKALQRLVREGIVIQDRAGPAYLYRFNRAHLAAPHIQALASLRQAFFERVRELVDGWLVEPKSVALFGSAARGDMTADSDIDLFVVRPDTFSASDEIWEEQLLELARKHKVNQFVFASSSSVYGGNDKTPFAEEDRISRTVSPYAATNGAVFVMVRALSAWFGGPGATPVGNPAGTSTSGLVKW
jgi:predicted nucleotidyltransferase